MTDRDRIDTALLAAHATGNKAALIALYSEAAELEAREAASFFLTHAYIHALEAGDARAAPLRAALVAAGAETAA